MADSNMRSLASISEKLSEAKISREEKDLIVEKGLRYRILESEKELRRINQEILELEKGFGKPFERLEKEGLPNDSDYKAHEQFMDLEALVYDRDETVKKLDLLRKLIE